MEKANWRYERKFRVEHLNRAALEAWLRQHPAGFNRAFPNRQINNIYYDTPELRCYAENMAGINERNKFRIRWYGELLMQIPDPTLEVKMKHNELGNKHSERIESFAIDNMPDLHKVSNYLSATGEAFIPALCNRYHRSYFLSADKRYRMTIDDRLSYQSPEQSKSQSPFWYELDDVVLELKYNREADDDVGEVTKHIPFRQTKNSKYAMGVALINW